ncbi:traB domain-containing protein-like [Mizuhopecten yessoensis]|uniref:traB domain-containing protein-like n=1 Tax=Mizuhopecten yessoensis TaxID=6573 RepID=UPI000B45E1DC|nr:traB domain-containing protein-like [Mizuhopecten yessoensis]
MDDSDTKNLVNELPAQGLAAHGDAGSTLQPSKAKNITEVHNEEESESKVTDMDNKPLPQEPDGIESGSSEFEDDEDEVEDGEDTGDESDIEDNDEDEAIRAGRDPNPTLPSTVTILSNNAETKVYLVGTAHFSHESQADVAETIQKTQPDIVIVELCDSRVHMLHLDEKLLLEEAKNINFQKIKQTINEIGYVQGIAYLLLLRMSAHIAKELGMAPGGEFRQAFREAKKVQVCKMIKLGDRPIQITMRRVLASLTFWQKVRLVWHLLFSIDYKYSKEDIEKCKDRDLLEQMLKDMAGEFPALAKVVVEERDTFLAFSLKNAAVTFREYQRKHGTEKNKALAHPVVVVGVVGIGHVPGIIANWEQYRHNIKEITTVPDQSVSIIWRTFGWAFRISLVGAVGMGCYKLCRWTFPMLA